MHRVNPGWKLAAPGAAGGLARWPAPWWQPALTALRLAGWPAIAATLLGLALLLTFQQVVAGVAEQGELARLASAAQVEGDWRCKLLRDRADRDACLAQVAAAHGRR